MRGELSIDLSALCANYTAIDALSNTNCQTAAVVKANAYGLGASIIAPALYQAGARCFFVATVDEGVALREVLPVDTQIFILNGFWFARGGDYITYHLTPVLASIYQVEQYRALAVESKRVLPAILHFDIGMNRLGLSFDEVKFLSGDASFLHGVDILYVMGHLSSSEECYNETNEKQRLRFEGGAAYFPNVKKCLSNSGGAFLGDAFHYDLVRPGIALYGGCAHAGMREILRDVVSLSVPILQVKDVAQGDFIGYNETYCIDKNKKLLILSIGYADGFLRSLGNAGSLYFKGIKLPIRGRVSMDLVICDLDNLDEESYPKEGDMVEVLGKHQSIDDLAHDAGTISYEILTNLGHRYKRLYLK